MDIGQSNLIKFRSAIGYLRCYARLRALANSHPRPSFFSMREISFPEMDVRTRSSDRDFLIEKRKSYINLWAPQIELSLHNVNGAACVHGRLKKLGGLSGVYLLTHGIVVMGFGTCAWTVWNLTTGGLPAYWNVWMGVSAAVLAGLLGAFLWVRSHGERHYQQLSQGEELFLASEIQRILKGRPAYAERQEMNRKAAVVSSKR